MKLWLLIINQVRKGLKMQIASDQGGEYYYTYEYMHMHIVCRISYLNCPASVLSVLRGL